MTRRAFTLIELLVTISIVALLVALVIPGYKGMQQRAASANCLGNLRQLGSALSLYLPDHGMILPALEMGRASVEENVPVIDNTLDRYIEDKRVFRCPGDRRIAAASGTSYNWKSFFNNKQAGSIDENNASEKVSILSDLKLSTLPIMSDKENSFHGKVNYLYADGSATKEFRFTVDPE